VFVCSAIQQLAIKFSGFRRFGRQHWNTHTLPHNLEGHAPGMNKWWKAWERTNGQIIEHISPFQQQIMSELFKDPGHKLLHKLKDHWMIFPPLAMYLWITSWTVHKYHEYEKEEWHFYTHIDRINIMLLLCCCPLHLLIRF
jgi:hypothetical protein